MLPGMVGAVAGFLAATTPASWHTLLDPTLNADHTANLATDNHRMVIDKAAYLYTGAASKIRVTFSAPAAGDGFKFNPFYVGHKGAAAPNFDGGQVKITNATADLFSLAAGASDLLSDEINFTFDSTKDLVLAGFIPNDGANDGGRYLASLTNWAMYHDNGGVGSSTAADTTPASQSSWGSHAVFAVTKIEVYG